MSEKRYVIVSPSHHKKPRAMFLKRTNKKDVWLNFVSGEISSFVLEHALEIAKLTPIGVYLVQSNGFFLEYYNEGDMPKFANFISFMQGKDCEVICDWRQTQAEPRFEAETPEEKREYVLYYYQKYASGGTYYLRGGGETFDKSEAYRMTFTEANEKINELSVKGQYQWLYKKVKIEQETPTPEAAPAPKKRVGYVVFYSDVDDHKEYRNSSKMRIWDNTADVFRTPEDAQFAADVLNSNSDTNLGWQVEQIEF